MSAQSMLLIKEFLQTISVDYKENPKHEDMVLIQLEDGLLLSLWAYEQKVVAAAILGEISDQQNDIHAACLKANFAGFPNIPYFLSLNPDTNELVIIGSWGTAETSFKQFFSSVTKFTQTALEWQSKIITSVEQSVQKHNELRTNADELLANKA